MTRQSRVTWIWWPLGALMLVAVVVIALTGYLRWAVDQPLGAIPEVFVIERGESIVTIARRLQAQGAIREPYSLIALARIEEVARQIKAGQYRIAPDATPRALLEQWVEGRVIDYPITLIEGWTYRQLRQALAAESRLAQTLTDVPETEIMRRLGATQTSPEGLFFPDTYRFTATQSDFSILQRAFERMQTILEPAWIGRAPDLPLENPYAALILASIVEKETGQASERPQIAGVFVNRLRRGMRLQTDPTVIYGLGEEFDGDLLRRHLDADTPFNTYTRAGLPPTPIALPGRAAIDAVLHPAETDALYFVARGDGSHVFSATLSQHNRAVSKYQLKRGS